MHEQIIANKIISDAKTYGKVRSITVEVGDIAHLGPKEMKKVLERLTNWKINIVSKKAKISCKCGFIGEPKILSHMHDNTVYECPKCKFTMPHSIEGKDIILIDVEIEDNDDYEEDYDDDRVEEE